MNNPQCDDARFLGGVGREKTRATSSVNGRKKIGMTATSNHQSERIRRLVDQIYRHKRLYYSGKPEISDTEYDQLEDELKSLHPSHPVLEAVGIEIGSSLPKVQHTRPMLSLQKTYDKEELLSWRKDRPVLATWKIDGNSLSLIYRSGNFVQAKTRGNGRLGEDVTPKARWVSDILGRVALPDGFAPDAELEVRGEIVCMADDFRQLCQEMVARGLPEPSHPRNTVAGLLGRKEHADLARYFCFLAFEVFADGPDKGASVFATERAKRAWLAEQGFSLPPSAFCNDDQSLMKFIDETLEKSGLSPYAIDGLVFTLDEVELHASLGETSHHPRYKISFKWQGDKAVAQVKEIHWKTSRHGVVTPVARIEPVELSGARISNVTLHNASTVRQHQLQAGVSIEIIRSGEVIPKFLQVVQRGPVEAEACLDQVPMPDVCPSCGHPLEDDGVRLLCPNTERCPAQQHGMVLQWIRAVEIEHLSEKRLTQWMEAEVVQSIPDLYLLTKEQLLELPLIKEKMAEKLLANIAASKEPELASFLLGLGIRGIGRTGWRALVAHAKSLEEVLALTVDEVTSLEGFAELTAKQVVEGLQNRLDLVKELQAVGVQPKPAHSTADEAADEAERGGEPRPLAGASLVLTGSLSRPRPAWVVDIEKAGGQVVGSVSKRTTAVVTDDPDSSSSKAKKARSLGVPFWSEEQLAQLLEG